MIWTAKINSTRKNEVGDVEVSMTYENGVDSPINEIIRTSTPAMINQMIKNRVAQLQAVEDYVADAQVGVVDTTPVVVASNVPTQEDLDKQAYLDKRNALLSLKQDVDLGITEQTDFDKALDEVKALKEQIS